METTPEQKQKLKYATVKVLKIDQELPFDVFIQHSNAFVLYRRMSTIFSTDVKQRLDENKIEVVFVPTDQEKVLIGYIGDKLDLYLRRKDISLTTIVYNEDEELKKETDEQRLTRLIHDEVNKETPVKEEDHTSQILKDLATLQNAPLEVRKKALRFAEKNLAAELSDPLIPQEEKANLLMAIGNNITDDLYQSFDINSVKRSKNVIEHTVQFLHGGKPAFQSLLHLASLDYNTFSHCQNTAIYAVALGGLVGIVGDGLRELALGSLLIDVGTVEVPREILYKEGSLTSEEWEIVKKHPITGAKMVKKILPHEPMIALIVAQHHERFDGSGYPYGLNKKQIHYFSQIVAIADTFDALTTNRPYAKAMSGYEAMMFILYHQKGLLDLELFKKFIGLLRKD